MKLTKNMVIFLGVVLITLSLGGCAELKKIIPPTKQELAKQAAERKAEKRKELKKRCNSADVLLSDLEKPIQQRSYAIKPGVICHG